VSFVDTMLEIIKIYLAITDLYDDDEDLESTGKTNHWHNTEHRTDQMNAFRLLCRKSDFEYIIHFKIEGLFPSKALYRADLLKHSHLTLFYSILFSQPLKRAWKASLRRAGISSY
jgi:hypothetical protein